VKALSIRQPWAFAILIGAKPVENRAWTTHFRGRVLIHASKREEHDDVTDVLEGIADVLHTSYDSILAEYERQKGLGCIVGAVTITDCVTEMDSSWFSGPYGFMMADPKPCQPIPCKGALGFFDVPADVAEEIRKAVRRLPATSPRPDANPAEPPSR
jgi:hypothetical protein